MLWVSEGKLDRDNVEHFLRKDWMWHGIVDMVVLGHRLDSISEFFLPTDSVILWRYGERGVRNQRGEYEWVVWEV